VLNPWKLWKNIFGAKYSDTPGGRFEVAGVLYNQGDYAEAEVEYRAVLKLWEEELGGKHPSTLGCRYNLGVALNAQGKYAEAEEVLRAVVRLREEG